MHDLSVIILSFNTRDLTRRCIETLFAASDEAGLTIECIVVDNASVDGSQECLAGLAPRVRLIANSKNVGFAAGNNQGLAAASSSIYLLLNSDAFVTAATLRAIIATFDQIPDAGMVGVRIDNPDGTLQAADGRFPSLWDDIGLSLGLDQLRDRARQTPSLPGPVDWVHGACMAIRSETYRAVGGLDERFFMYSEEVDWCRRVRNAGWDVWYLPHASVMHIGSASSSIADQRRRISLYRSRLGFRRRSGGAMQSTVLWGCMLVGLAARVVLRYVMTAFWRRSVGRQTVSADWELLRALARCDPLARWAVA